MYDLQYRKPTREREVDLVGWFCLCACVDYRDVEIAQFGKPSACVY
jgi:hypothetical protein